MKKCPECAELVQDDARVCRFCRYDFSKQGAGNRPSVQPSRQYNAGCLVAICIGLIAMIAMAISSGSEPNKEVTKSEKPSAKEAAAAAKPEPQSPYADTAKQTAWIGSGQESIKNQLKDPESATFRNVHFYSGGGTPVVCGQVNARNGFGGYTGFERFVAAGTLIAAVESQVEGGLDPVWDKFCKRASWDRM